MYNRNYRRRNNDPLKKILLILGGIIAALGLGYVTLMAAMNLVVGLLPFTFDVRRAVARLTHIQKCVLPYSGKKMSGFCIHVVSFLT